MSLPGQDLRPRAAEARRRPRGACRPVLRAAAAAVLCATFAAGCGGPPPPAAEPPIPGFDGRREQIAGRDFSPLAGRRIVLDPGHGGFFRGARGPNGLTEAEVNLGVALHLRGLLEWAGAEVAMTRTADTDFLTPADSSLAGDLAMRVALSDSVQPDVFVSIHHNSNAALDRTLNETQTYYPLDDDGASLDLARSIHRHLVLNLGIRPASIRPGNFHVLRHATVPAVLGEPAMISHPVMAERLTLAASHRLEAEAYFLGLLDYFSAGRPSWSGAPVDTVLFGADGDPEQLVWDFEPGGRPGPDPSRIRLELDGIPVQPRIGPDGRRVVWRLPPDLPPRPHVVEIRGRNLAGRATPRRRTLLQPRAAAAPEVTVRLAADGWAGLGWRGPGGAPLPRGTLRLGGQVSLPVAPDAPDRALVPWSDPEATVTASFLPDGNDDPRPCSVEVVRLAPDTRLHLVQHDGRPFAPASGWRSRMDGAGSGPLVTTRGLGPVWLEGDGVQPLVDPAPGRAAGPRTVAGAADRWRTTALLPALAGRTIVIDPVGGGTEDDGAGPLGLRGADLNLATARHAAELLRGAGARVVLTRDDETDLRPVEKVRLAGRVGADFVLSIGRGTPAVPREVMHHPGSAAGEAWAAAATRAAALLPPPQGNVIPPTAVRETTAYLLRHTACPALAWRFDPIASAAGEWRQVRPGWARAEARAILLALAAVAGHGDVWIRSLAPDIALEAVTAAGGPAPEAVTWARLDGNFPWTPLPPAAPVADSVPALTSGEGPGWPALGDRHVLEVHAGTDWGLWLLERRGAGWRAGPLLGAAAPLP